jgi:hypothetical protein
LPQASGATTQLGGTAKRLQFQDLLLKLGGNKQTIGVHRGSHIP